METNELMLGDIIKSSHLGVIGKVCTLNSNDVTVNAIDDENNYYFGSIDAWEGIPLTDKLLVLNDWVDDTGEYQYFHKAFAKAKEEPFFIEKWGKRTIMFDGLYRIKYVHELQQLLRLSKHPELANSFKIK